MFLSLFPIENWILSKPKTLDNWSRDQDLTWEQLLCDAISQISPALVINKTKDWALVQTAALAINQGFNVRLG